MKSQQENKTEKYKERKDKNTYILQMCIWEKKAWGIL